MVRGGGGEKRGRDVGDVSYLGGAELGSVHRSVRGLGQLKIRPTYFALFPIYAAASWSLPPPVAQNHPPGEGAPTTRALRKAFVSAGTSKNS